MLDAFLIFCTVLFAFWWFRLSKKHQSLPPSPGTALPIIGHFHLFKGSFLSLVKGWREKLGNVFTLQMGGQRVVVVNGYDAISQILIKHHESLLERPRNFSHEELFHFKGIISLGGNEWKEHRAFLTSTLRGMGMGKNLMAERIQNESEYLLEELAKEGGSPIDVCDLVNMSVSNVICGVSFSHTFDHRDEQFLHLLENRDNLFKMLGSSAEVNFFPWLKYIPGDMFSYKKLVKICEQMRFELKKLFEQNERKVNTTDETFEDMVHAFLTEQEKKKMGDPNHKKTTDNENLISTVFAFFNAGTETVSKTVTFALLYLINFPELQQKLFREIDDNVGLDRLPALADKSKLTLLNAFICETQRFANVVPFGIDRLSTKDIEYDGYRIPKGTSIMVVLDSVLFDKDIWGDPEVFRPERFIVDGALVVKKELIPFSMGHRHCIGEALASMELYLFISALIQTYEFLPENPNSIPTMEPDVGFTNCPKPFKLRAVRRAH